MHWKLSFQLSMFGLIMAFGTISLIPDNVEWIFWLMIFSLCAYIIAKVCTKKYFMQGFWVNMFNCLWLIIVHYIFFDTWASNHHNMLIAWHPRFTQVLLGPVIGALSGLVQGLFAFIASKLVKPNSVVV
jgi:hypothetical protein